MVNLKTKNSKTHISFILLCLISVLLLFSCQWNPDQQEVDKDSDKWMSNLSETTSLTSLVIPGTHDTCAIYDFLLGGASAAQDIPLFRQLEYGVRFIDIRLQKKSDGKLGVYHGIKYMYINFDEVVEQCKRFLEYNESEFILMMVKEEVFMSSGDGSSFANDIYDLIESDPSLWADPTDWGGVKNTLPSTIAPLRGKILLIRDYKESTKEHTKGVSIYKGEENSFWVRQGDSAKVPQGDIKTIDDKWRQVSDYLDNRARENDDNKLYLHSVAAYNALIGGLPNIDNVAKVVNPRLIDKLTTNKATLSKKPLGILMCDKVNPKLITAIYSLNF